MNEQLLQFIWQYKLFDTSNLKTVSGHELHIQNVGEHNPHAGPDFTNCRVNINSTLWAGNVELHIKTSDWFKHQHHKDAAYSNIILHVVYENDILLSESEQAITLVIGNRINNQLLSRYEQLMQQKNSIACGNSLKGIPKSTIHFAITRHTYERLEAKVGFVNNLLNLTQNNWEHVMSVMVARYMGGNVNAEPMTNTAVLLSPSVIQKYSDDLFKVEALVFGAAGMLQESMANNYQNDLRREFNYLKKLHQITPLLTGIWKMAKMRPASFPTIRLAQWASLMCSHPHLFSRILACKDIKQLQSIFKISTSSYWQTHYSFSSDSKALVPTAGKTMSELLIINAIIPAMFAYAKYKGDESISERALDLLQQIPAEKNAIIKMWKEYEIEVSNAHDTQGLLQLYNQHCKLLDCLNCSIGHKILSRDL